MDATFSEQVLAARAASALSPTESLGWEAEPLFDPAVPLLVPPVPPEGFPDFVELFEIVPDPYARLIQDAYVLMSDFAGACFPGLGKLAYAEPFFEWLMHANVFQPYYRDHIIHQVRVAAIGDMLLDQAVDSQSLLDRAVEALRPGLDRITAQAGAFVRRAWWLTALFHDCGYPREFHHGQFERLCAAYESSLASPTASPWRAARRRLNAIAGGLTARDLENREQERHEVAGALELDAEERRYEQGVGAHEGREYRRRRRALFALATKAVLRHHVRRGGSAPATEPIAFDDNPLGYLLILSDEIHEVERTVIVPLPRSAPGPRSAVMTSMKYQTSEIRKARARSTGGRGRPRTLKLTFYCRPSAARIRGKPRREWEADKQSTLRAGLRTGAGEPFERIEVKVADFSAGPRRRRDP